MTFAPPRSPILVAAGALAAGLILRVLALPYATPDATDFLLPWYAHARAHGWASLGEGFTNYAPAYSYLLIAATKLDGLAPPLALVKLISAAFELGCAGLAGRLVARLGSPPMRQALGFAAAWLLPSVLHNGPLWGQSDSIWAFFVLATLLALLAGRPAAAMLAFGFALAVKAQAMFLAPLVLGLLLRGDLRFRDCLLIPLPYLALALPPALLGRPLAELALVYLEQAGTYGALSMNAANLFVFVPPAFYDVGRSAGLAAAALVALTFAIAIARRPRFQPDRLVLATCCCLALMPFVLPKMHERYFYAFELVLLVLAVARPGLLGPALLAQMTSGLAYMPFDGLSGLGLPIAALTNGVLLAFLLRRLFGRGDPFRVPGALRPALAALWLAYAAQLALVVSLMPTSAAEQTWPVDPTDPRGAAVFAASVLVLLWLQAFARAEPAPEPRPS